MKPGTVGNLGAESSPWQRGNQNLSPEAAGTEDANIGASSEEDLELRKECSLADTS